MSSTTHTRRWFKQAIFTNEFNFSGLKSSIRLHFVDVNKMFAAQEQFRDITKMVCACLRGLTKTYHFAVIGNMVRNAGQLPQPFWLGAARGGGSCSAARYAART